MDVTDYQTWIPSLLKFITLGQYVVLRCVRTLAVWKVIEAKTAKDENDNDSPFTKTVVGRWAAGLEMEMS